MKNQFLFHRYFLIAVLLGGFWLLPINIANADDAEKFAGFDGVIVNCRVSDLVKFERKLCNRVIGKIEQLAVETNIGLKNIGTFKTKSASRPLDEEGGDHGFNKPLVLRIMVSGTKGRTAGSMVQLLAGVPKKQGFLVIWDKRLLSSGPARKIVQVVPGVVAKRAKQLFEKLRQGQN